jgi:hypothetical protein
MGPFGSMALEELGMKPAKKRWMALSEQPAVEQDPDELFRIVQEISKLLEQKEATGEKKSQHDVA